MKDDLSGLTDLHKTLDDAADQLAAFIGCGKNGEVATDSLVQEAEKTLSDLTKWRAGLKGALIGTGNPH
jgi:hypothetical protein